VVAGLVVTIVLSTCVDLLVVYTGLFPSRIADNTDAHWAIIACYRAVIAIFGCWVTARLAPSKPMKHTLIAGGIGMVLAVIGAAFAWNKGPEFGPHWFGIAVVLTALPCAWIGGKLNGDRPRAVPRFLAKGDAAQ
jgi:peptidoglycan/LPS O-acetylase OafA/YrhL